MLPGLWALTVVSLVNGLLLLVSYIANNTFPQPLSEDEEAKYLKLLTKGDENARNVLAERNLRLVAHIVKKFDGTGEDSDDLISIGTIGLIKAINTFNPGKGTRLATYAARCIENEMSLTNPSGHKWYIWLLFPVLAGVLLLSQPCFLTRLLRLSHVLKLILATLTLVSKLFSPRSLYCLTWKEHPLRTFLFLRHATGRVRHHGAQQLTPSYGVQAFPFDALIRKVFL